MFGHSLLNRSVLEVRERVRVAVCKGSVLRKVGNSCTERHDNDYLCPVKVIRTSLAAVEKAT